MSWLSCCFRPNGFSGAESALASKGACEAQAIDGGVHSHATSLDHGDGSIKPSTFFHQGSSRVRKSTEIRLSEEALSTTPTGLNPLAYFLPFSDDNETCSSGARREDDMLRSQTSLGPKRQRCDFAELCCSLDSLEYLGEGSNGIVYSASWHGARVAVKFLLGNTDDSNHLQRCFTEAVLTRVLSHPCVVQCFATAIAALTPELLETITARCQPSTNPAVQPGLHTSSLSPLALEAPGAEQLRPLPPLSRLYEPATVADSLNSDVPPSAVAASGAPPPASSSRFLNPHPLQNRAVSTSALPAPGVLPNYLDFKSQAPGRESLDAASAAAASAATLEMQKMAAFFATECNSMEMAGGVCEGGGSSGLVGAEEEGGISLAQALADLQAEPGRHCTIVVMEYMEAGTLHAAIMRGDFSARRSLEHRGRLLALLLTAQELAQGMAHLHGLDILHGDLKPTNVLLRGAPCQYAPSGPAGANGLACTDCRGWVAKVADLGLARPCKGESEALSSDQWGALAYLAPEAAKGSCCKASDVYSFGVMLWEMAAGVRPYLGLTTPQVLMGLVAGTLQLTWPSDGSVYAPLRALGVACTDTNAAERPTFEMAARILGRMVKHVRSVLEPLRQRHSSALSMEIAAAAAAAAGGGCAGAQCTGGSTGSRASPSSPHSLSHAPRSMPMFVQAVPAAGAGSNGGAVPGTKLLAPSVAALRAPQGSGGAAIPSAAVGVMGMPAACAAAAAALASAGGAPRGGARTAAVQLVAAGAPAAPACRPALQRVPSRMAASATGNQPPPQWRTRAVNSFGAPGAGGQQGMAEGGEEERAGAPTQPAATSRAENSRPFQSIVAHA